MTSLGDLLLERREALGWSRTQLSRKTGVPSPTIEKWETGGVREPPLRGVLRLAGALGLSLEDVRRAAFTADPSGRAGGRRALPESADLDEAIGLTDGKQAARGRHPERSSKAHRAARDRE